VWCREGLEFCEGVEHPLVSHGVSGRAQLPVDLAARGNVTTHAAPERRIRIDLPHLRVAAIYRVVDPTVLDLRQIEDVAQPPLVRMPFQVTAFLTARRSG
jgi:hypothetical protein